MSDGATSDEPTMAGASMGSLPVDLVLLLSKLLSTADQAALARTSRYFHWILNPVIYSDNVKHGNSSCLFDAAKSGVVGTLEHAVGVGAKVNQYFVHPSAAKAAAAAAAAAGSATPGGTPVTSADDDDATENQEAAADGEDPSSEHSDLSYTPLHAAAKHNQVDVARWLLDNGADINAPSWKFCNCQYSDVEHSVSSHAPHPPGSVPSPFWRPLHTALCYRASSVAELLIERGADVHSVSDETGRKIPAIADAASSGLVSTIKLLTLDTNLDVNEADYEGNTALHYAALHWKPEMFSDRAYFARSAIPKLLVLGARIDEPNNAGYSPLLFACHRGNFDAAMILLAAGASWEPPGRRRFSLVGSSGASCGTGGPRLGPRLLSGTTLGPVGGPVDTGDRAASSPLFHCCLTRSGIADHCGGRRPPLEQNAFMASRLELLKMLVDRDADVEGKVRGMTPLMFATRVFPPLTDCARTLLDASAEPNGRSDDGRTALHYLLQSWRQKPDSPVPPEPWLLDECACLLIARGARLDIPDWSTNPSTPLEILRQPKYQRLGTLPAIARQATAANISRVQLAKALEEEAALPNSWCMSDLLLLADRVFGLPARVTRHLLDHHLNKMVDCPEVDEVTDTSSDSDDGNDNNNGPDGNSSCKRVNGATPTKHATFDALVRYRRSPRTNDALFLRTLEKRIRGLCLRTLQLGVTVPGVVLPQGGRTYLHLAVRWGEKPVVEALLERGADVDVFDDFFQTPLAVAVVEDFDEIAEMLMREVADPHLAPTPDEARRLYRRQCGEEDDDDDEEEDYHPLGRQGTTTTTTPSGAAAAANEVLSSFLTPFELAIRHSRRRILQHMLSHYALPTIPARAFHSYVHRACDAGDLDVLQLLLEKGAPATGGPNCPNPPAVHVMRRMLARPFSAAVALKAFDAVTLLVKHGAGLDEMDSRARSVRSLLRSLTGDGQTDPQLVRLAELFAHEHDLSGDDGVFCFELEEEYQLRNW